jgi:hypothetical protein
MVAWGAEKELLNKLVNINAVDAKFITEVLDFLNKSKCYIRYWRDYFRKKKNAVVDVSVVEAFCGDRIEMPKILDKVINLIGTVMGTCSACCGFLYVTREEQGDVVIYDLITCSCHPWGDVTVYLMIPPSLRESVTNFANVVY